MDFTEKNIREIGTVYAFVTARRVNPEKVEEVGGFRIDEPTFAMDYTEYDIDEIYAVVLSESEDEIIEMLVEEEKEVHTPAIGLNRIKEFAEKWNGTEKGTIWFKSEDEYSEMLLPHLL